MNKNEQKKLIKSARALTDENRKVTKQFRLERQIVDAMESSAVKFQCTQTDIVRAALRQFLGGAIR